MKRTILFLYVTISLVLTTQFACKNSQPNAMNSNKTTPEINSNELTVEMKFVKLQHIKPPDKEIYVSLHVKSNSKDTLWLLIPARLDLPVSSDWPGVHWIDAKQISGSNIGYSVSAASPNLSCVVVPVAPGTVIEVPSWRFFTDSITSQDIYCYRDVTLGGKPFSDYLKEGQPLHCKPPQNGGTSSVVLKTFKPSPPVELHFGELVSKHPIPVQE